MAVGAASVLSPPTSPRSPRPNPRPADDGAAGDDHHRPDRRLRGQLLPRPGGRQLARQHSGAASRRGAGCIWRRRCPRRSSWSRCSSFPRARAIWSPGPRRRRRAGVLTTLFGGRGRPQDRRDPRQLLAGPPPALPRLIDPVPRRRPPDRLGGASCWRRSSSSSASTSSSTTARRCGSWPAFTEEVALRATSSPGLVSIAAVLRHARADRPDRPQAAAPHRLGRHGGDAGRAWSTPSATATSTDGQPALRPQLGTSRSSRPTST